MSNNWRELAQTSTFGWGEAFQEVHQSFDARVDLLHGWSLGSVELVEELDALICKQCTPLLIFYQQSG